MVEIITPKIAPTVRPAGQVSLAPARDLKAAGAAMQGVADKFSAYYEEKASEEAELIWTQAQVDWTRDFKERARTAGDGFTGATLKEYDAYVDGVMKTVPLRRVDEMNHAFAKYRINLEAKSLEVEAAARARARAERQAKIQENRHTVALERVEDGENAWYVNEDLGEGLNEKQQRALLGVLTSHAITSGSRGSVEALKDGLIDGDDYNDILSPAERIKLRGQLERREGAFAAEDLAFLSDQGDAHIANAMKGVDVDLSEFNAQVDESLLDERKKEQLKETVNEAVEYETTLHSVNGMSVSELGDTVTQATANADSPQDVRNAGSLANAARESVKARMEDSAQFAITNSPHLQAMLAETTLGDDPRTVTDETAMRTSAYLTALDAEQERLGIPVDARRILPKGEAKNMADAFNNMTSGEAGSYANEMIRSWGEGALKVKNELIEAGLSGYAKAQLWRSDDHGLQNLIAKAKPLKAEDIVSQYNTNPNKLGSYIDLQRDIRRLIEDYEQAFSAGRENKGEAFISEMVDVATLVYAKSFEFGDQLPIEDFLKMFFKEEVVNEDHMSFIVPEGVDAQEMERKLNGVLYNAYSELVPKLDPDTLRRVTGLDEEYINSTLAAEGLRGSGRFVLNSTGDGVELQLRGDGSTGIEYTFDELKGMYPGLTAISPEGIAVGKPRRIFDGDAPDLEYESETDPNYLEDLRNGTIRPMQPVTVGGETIVPIGQED